jgi:adenylosuccinate synthase
MINGISWLVVTKLDVLDELVELPICVAYNIHGKKTMEIPPQDSGYAKIEPIYEKMPGWRTSTEGIRQRDKLPNTARDYLAFLERETGARIGMISTGPDRDQTIVVEEFAAELRKAAQSQTRAQG